MISLSYVSPQGYSMRFGCLTSLASELWASTKGSPTSSTGRVTRTKAKPSREAVTSATWVFHGDPSVSWRISRWHLASRRNTSTVLQLSTCSSWLSKGRRLLFQPGLQRWKGQLGAWRRAIRLLDGTQYRQGPTKFNMLFSGSIAHMLTHWNMRF